MYQICDNNTEYFSEKLQRLSLWIVVSSICFWIPVIKNKTNIPLSVKSKVLGTNFLAKKCTDEFFDFLKWTRWSNLCWCKEPWRRTDLLNNNCGSRDIVSYNVLQTCWGMINLWSCQYNDFPTVWTCRCHSSHFKCWQTSVHYISKTMFYSTFNV